MRNALQILRTYTLKTLGDDYEIISPIVVEVAASNGIDGRLYWLSVKNLQNELIFGVGRTISSAEEMLRELLKIYYDNLMSSNLDKFNTNDYRIIDKKKLNRSIRCRHN